MTVVVGLVLVFVAIGFAGKRQAAREIQEVSINVSNREGNFFIDEQEIQGILNEAAGMVFGNKAGAIDLKEMEMQVEANAFVKKAEVYHDIAGNLVVNVTQSQPIGRLLNYDGSDMYVDVDGFIFPLNAQHTARVPIIEVEGDPAWNTQITETSLGADLLALLKFIGKDEFWRAQIAHIVVEEQGEVVMIPQVTKQQIVFGAPNDLERKFEKLRVFYKEILPAKGWNTYSYVNLKFENQIVCK